MILENNTQCQFNECNIVDRCVVSIGRHPIKMYDYFKKEPYRSNMLRHKVSPCLVICILLLNVNPTNIFVVIYQKILPIDRTFC